MTSTKVLKPDSLKDQLISFNTEVMQSVFAGPGLTYRASDRKNQYDLVQELKNKKSSKEKLDELKSLCEQMRLMIQEFQRKNSSEDKDEELDSLCYQKLQLLIGIGADEDESLDLAIKNLQGILSHRQLIKDNTTSINFSFETGSYPEQKSPQWTEKTQKLLKNLEELFQTVNPKSITEFRWEMGRRFTGRAHYVDIYRPTQIYSITSQKLVQIISTFTNLVNFQYISRDTQPTFEKMVSKTISSLPNLEVLVIAREEKEVPSWLDEYVSDIGYEELISKMMGDSLSSLTKLKRLHLQGLISPRSDWSKLNWKSPLEYLKVTECIKLHGNAIFTLAQVFRKTLLGLLIGPDISRDHGTYEKMEFGKEFEVLEELSVREYLGEHEVEILIDNMSQAPKLKHFDIHLTEIDVLSQIKEKIEQSESAWPSLLTLNVDEPENLDSDDEEEELGFGLFNEKLKEVNELISHKFGLLDTEWDWKIKDDQNKVNYKFGKIKLKNDKLIEVKVKNVFYSERTSLQYLDTVKLITQL